MQSAARLCYRFTKAHIPNLRSKQHHNTSSYLMHSARLQIIWNVVTTFFGPRNGRVLPKVVTNQKRDIVDTSFHASCAFGHNPSLGLDFPYTWELESRWTDRFGALNGLCLDVYGLL